MTVSRLVVILHADVVGSTRLVQQDERVAHERIQDAFGRFSQTIPTYGGVSREIRGDGLLAEFGEATAASRSAAFAVTCTPRHRPLCRRSGRSHR